jgi:hypothetical protein
MSQHPDAPYEISAIPYADAPATRGTRAWAGALVIGAGLALVGLGGCFLIGVLAIVSPDVVFGKSVPARSLTGPEASLMVSLYICAFISFFGGGILIFLGVRRVLKLFRS